VLVTNSADPRLNYAPPQHAIAEPDSVGRGAEFQDSRAGVSNARAWHSSSAGGGSSGSGSRRVAESAAPADSARAWILSGSSWSDSQESEAYQFLQEFRGFRFNQIFLKLYVSYVTEVGRKVETLLLHYDDPPFIGE